MEAKTIKELADSYGVNRHTFVCWLREFDLLSLRIGRLFPPAAVRKIHEKLGDPREYLSNSGH